MIRIENKEECCGCAACYNICPNDAIEMLEDEKGFKYPKINQEKCVKCNLCEKVCPILMQRNITKTPKAYMCINKNKEVVLNSSSGGTFYVLAEEIINKNGIVFGAIFDDKFEVIHSYIESNKEISKMQGSKYVQSDIQKTYEKAKKFLNEGKYVLYTGTPCQIEGLKTFLGKEYNKLYTQDIICHGVPSRKIWRYYLKSMTNSLNNIEKINYRDKKISWKNFSMNIKYKNRRIYNKSHNKDLYMKAFIQNLILTDSCYNCKFKKKDRNSDITLADFWGISKMDKSINSRNGVSLVIINTQKGNELLEILKKKCTVKEVNLDDAIRYNQAYIKSANINNNRDAFFREVEEDNIKRKLKKYTYSQSFIKKVYRKIFKK